MRLRAINYCIDAMINKQSRRNCMIFERVYVNESVWSNWIQHLTLLHGYPW